LESGPMLDPSPDSASSPLPTAHTTYRTSSPTLCCRSHPACLLESFSLTGYQRLPPGLDVVC